MSVNLSPFPKFDKMEEVHTAISKPFGGAKRYWTSQTEGIVDTLTITEPAQGEDVLDKAIDALTAYFEPKTNIAYEEYLFRQAKGESILSYYTRLKRLSETWEFQNVDREIKSQIILHCSSSKLSRKALSEPTITLQRLLDYGKTLELTSVQAESIEKQEVIT